MNGFTAKSIVSMGIAILLLCLPTRAKDWSAETAKKANATQASTVATSSAAGIPAAGVDDWVRLSGPKPERPDAMQTAIVRYEGHYPQAGRRVTVDLVGAVHIGDETYYRELNKRFQDYEVVLYELVAPEGTIVRPGERVSSRNPLGAAQSGAKSLLNLEHQLEKVDYTASNFVHADMSPDDFFESMKDRNEGIVSMFMQMMGQQIAAQASDDSGPGGAEMEMLFALFSSDRARRLKIAMAKQLAKSEGLLSGFGGDQGSTLITERNKVALGVLRGELLRGRQRAAVFYGAGHLPDMDKRLREDFKLRPTRTEWLTAWDLRPAGSR